MNRQLSCPTVNYSEKCFMTFTPERTSRSRRQEMCAPVKKKHENCKYSHLYSNRGLINQCNGLCFKFAMLGPQIGVSKKGHATHFYTNNYNLKKWHCCSWYFIVHFKLRENQSALNQKHFIILLYVFRYLHVHGGSSFLVSNVIKRLFICHSVAKKYFFQVCFQGYFASEVLSLTLRSSPLRLLNYGFYLCIFCRQMESRRTKIERLAMGTFRVPLSHTFILERFIVQRTFKFNIKYYHLQYGNFSLLVKVFMYVLDLVETSLVKSPFG